METAYSEFVRLLGMTDRAGNAFELISNGISWNWLVEIFVEPTDTIVSLISRYFVRSLNQFGISFLNREHWGSISCELWEIFLRL